MTTTFRTILFPTDFTADSRAAYESVIGLARTDGARVIAIHSVLTGASNEEVNAARAALEAATACADANLAIERRIVRAPAPDVGILDTARESKVDLIALATHGHRGIRHALLGSVAERVVQLAPCSVFTVRHAARPLDPSRIECIVCAVDFSEPSKSALEAAVALAENRSARLVALHVVEPVIYPVEYGMVAVSVAELERGAVARAREELAKLLASVVKGSVRAQACVESGAAFEVICDRARAERADVIVVATHGLTGLKHLLIGSTAERVVRTADRPVLTVKPQGIGIRGG